VNRSKSCIFASRNVNHVVLNIICANWRCRRISLDSGYLGSTPFITKFSLEDVWYDEFTSPSSIQIPRNVMLGNVLRCLEI
jgi:hypothetical protein